MELWTADHRHPSGANRVVELRGGEASRAVWLTVSEAVASEPPLNGPVSLARQATAEEVASRAEAAVGSPGGQMGQRLVQLVTGLPIGTKLELLLMLWMLVSGQLLASRGLSSRLYNKWVCQRPRAAGSGLPSSKANGRLLTY